MRDRPPRTTIEHIGWLIAWMLMMLVLRIGVTRAAQLGDSHSTTQALRELRRQFQTSELITARSSSFIFSAGQPPRIVWRDVEEVRRLGSDGRLTVQWFDADLNEAANPVRAGRWGAHVSGTAPNGTVVRRSMTFYCRLPGFLAYWPSDAAVSLQPMPGPIAESLWHERQDEISSTLAGTVTASLNDSEAASA